MPAPKNAETHHCHAIGCVAVVGPKMLMCGGHWKLVPYAERTRVLKLYRPGQEIDKSPSAPYVLAASNAIRSVAKAEGKEVPPEWRLI